MQSKISIINNGLIILGQSPISSLDDKDKVTVAANVVYDQCRMSLLSMHTWNFAITRSRLAQLEQIPTFRYKYKYQLPEDLITVVRVNENVNYKIEGQTILTDDNSCELKYVMNHDTPEQFSVSFANALSYYIAAKLAYTLTGTGSSQQASYQLFMKAFEDAIAHDDKQDISDQMGQQLPLLVEARYETI